MTARLAGILPGYDDMFGSQRDDARCNKQRGPAQFEQNLTRIEGSVIVIAALSPLPYDDEIGTAGFALQCVARKVQHRSPFDVPTIRADDTAEPVSSLRQRRVHLPYVSFRRLLYDHTFCNEQGRNRAG